jgi:hypothetical protein
MKSFQKKAGILTPHRAMPEISGEDSDEKEQYNDADCFSYSRYGNPCCRLYFHECIRPDR